MKIYIYTFYQETIVFLKDTNKDKDLIIENKISNKEVSKVFHHVIKELFKDVDKTYSELEYISFINGPGSFTSLRFFLSYIKALHVSHPHVKIIPINMLEMIAFSENGENDVVLGGTKVFSDFYHHAKYYKNDKEFKIIEAISIKDKKELIKLNPLYMGINPDFKVREKEFDFNVLYALSEYKIKNNIKSNIDLLTPYYYKGHNGKN